MLTPGIYGEEFRPKVGPFGFRCGQMRANRVVHNGNWYNKKGEKIGWGDLSEDDLQTISLQIDDNELFVILGEHDGFWRLKPEEQLKPKIKYILQKCRYVICKGTIHESSKNSIPFKEKNGIIVSVNKKKSFLSSIFSCFFRRI